MYGVVLGGEKEERIIIIKKETMNLRGERKHVALEGGDMGRDKEKGEAYLEMIFLAKESCFDDGP